jgi:ketosteroid isomerase-like protein
MKKIDTIDTWYKVAKAGDVDALDTLLADDAVMVSPVVFMPQEGKAITKLYLAAAFKVFFNETFNYVRELRSEDSAGLEFEVIIDGIQVNGIDLIQWNEQGQIVEFKVMIRPLKAINIIHQKMGEILAG